MSTAHKVMAMNSEIRLNCVMLFWFTAKKSRVVAVINSGLCRWWFLLDELVKEAMW